eukprot:scaffold25440_cov31-Attheya_sp.AAC.3
MPPAWISLGMDSCEGGEATELRWVLSQARMAFIVGGSNDNNSCATCNTSSDSAGDKANSPSCL